MVWACHESIWPLYDDLREHRLHFDDPAVRRRVRRTVARLVVFLRSEETAAALPPAPKWIWVVHAVQRAALVALFTGVIAGFVLWPAVGLLIAGGAYALLWVVGFGWNPAA